LSCDEFWAEKDRGAFLNGRQINTQASDELIIVLYEAQNPARDIPMIMTILSKFRRARCLGSVALDLAYLSMGSASAFINPFPSRSFDFAGGWLIVKEARCVFTDMSGNALESVETGLVHSAPLLVSANEKIHDKLLGFISVQ